MHLLVQHDRMMQIPLNLFSHDLLHARIGQMINDIFKSDLHSLFVSYLVNANEPIA